MPGQIGNLNALRTGRHSKQLRMGNTWRGISAKRPELTELERSVASLDRQLRAEVVAVRGEPVTLTDASLIATACVAAFAELHALWVIASGELSKSAEADILRLGRQAAAERNKAIRELHLDPDADENRFDHLVRVVHRELAAEQGEVTDAQS